MKNLIMLPAVIFLWLNLYAANRDNLYSQKTGAGYSWMPPTNQLNLWYQSSPQGFVFDYNRHFRKFSRSMVCRQTDNPSVKGLYNQNLEATTHSFGAGYHFTTDFLSTKYIKCGFPLMIYSGFGYMDIKSQQIPEGFTAIPDLSNKRFMLFGIKPAVYLLWDIHPRFGLYFAEYIDLQFEGLRNKANENKIELLNPYAGIYFNL